MSKQWTKQSQRLLEYALANPNTDLSAPACNFVAAGEGHQYVSSFSKRVSEVRAEMRRRGGDFILSRDEWFEGQRLTHYRLIPQVGQTLTIGGSQ